jgi:hypothetical protein
MEAAPPPALHSPAKVDQLRKDARRLEHSVERALNDFNRKLLLLKASGSLLAGGGGSGGVEQQPLLQPDSFAEAEAAAAEIELELQASERRSFALCECDIRPEPRRNQSSDGAVGRFFTCKYNAKASGNNAGES